MIRERWDGENMYDEEQGIGPAERNKRTEGRRKGKQELKTAGVVKKENEKFGRDLHDAIIYRW